LRTVWIAAFCLALLGGLFATKVTASMAPAEEIALDATTIRATFVPDTLTASDRFDIAYLPPPAEAILPTESVEVVQDTPRIEASSNTRGLKSPNAKRAAVMLPKPRPKIRLSKNSNPPKAAADLKSCAQRDGLGGMLLSFSGSLPCS
jgi:hypothetical protein